MLFDRKRRCLGLGKNTQTLCSYFQLAGCKIIVDCSAAFFQFTGYGNDKLTSQLAGFFISFGSDIILIKNNLSQTASFS